MSIRVAVVDDQALVRGGLAVMLSLQDDIEVAAEAGDGAAAIEIARPVGPALPLLQSRPIPQTDRTSNRRVLWCRFTTHSLDQEAEKWLGEEPVWVGGSRH